jgi:hypothetical protein
MTTTLFPKAPVPWHRTITKMATKDQRQRQRKHSHRKHNQMQTTDRGRGIVSTPEKFDEVAFRADLVARAEALVRSTSGQDIFTVISEAVCVERLRYGWTFGPNSV